MKKMLSIGLMSAAIFAYIVGCNPQQTKSNTSSNHVALEPQEIYANNCSSCHGGNLQGSLGPSLQNIGSKLSKEEISLVIQKGKGDMPAQSQISGADRDKLSAWLAGKK